MSAAGGLEARYRRLMRIYPAWYRARHGEELLGVLMTAATPGQRRPGAREMADLLWSGLRIRARTILRGAGREPWTAAFALFAVLLPLLMLLLRVTQAVLNGTKYGFSSPAGILIGYSDPDLWSRVFRLNPFMIALTGDLTHALTAGPLPPLVLAVLVVLGLRRTAAAVAASVPLIYLAIELTGGYSLDAGPRGDLILYFYAIEALALLASAGARPSWKTLRWQPTVLLAIAAVALGFWEGRGLWGLLVRVPYSWRTPRWRLYRAGYIPRNFLEQMLGFGPANLGRWLLAQGTMLAVIMAALAILLMSSPVNRRVLILLAVPYVMDAVRYACSLFSQPLPAALGSAVASLPLLLVLLAAVALSVAARRSAGAGANPQARG